MKNRYLASAITDDALKARKMAFISGPRQVGKTTIAKSFLEDPANYRNWDATPFRRAWVRNPEEAVGQLGKGPIVLDELHKYRSWKSSLKGLYDTWGDQLPIIITGSARLEMFRKGGDSLLGRYLPYHLHPFSVAERVTPPSPDELEVHRPIYPCQDLLSLSGFPEPLLSGSRKKALRWARLRMERILQEDVRDLRNIDDLVKLQVLVDLIPTKVKSTLSIKSLHEDVGVAYDTARSWVGVLKSLFIIFGLSPYHRNIKRSLKKEQKVYLYDPMPLVDTGAANENLIALHLLKACQYWTDTAEGEFLLHYIRNKDRDEVDFCVVRDKKVWMLVECNGSDTQVPSSLLKFTAQLEPKHSFLTVTKKGYDRIDLRSKIRVLDMEKFLSMLV